jgi:PAS domain S-box-containing protein
MQLPLDSVLDHRLRRWSRYLTVALISIAIVVLAGWQFDRVMLRTFFLPPVSMNPLTAIAFILAGGSAWFLIKDISKRIALVLAAMVILIGLLKYADLILGLNIAADSFLYTNSLLKENDGIIPNRMAPVTAACLVLTGITLVLTPYEKKFRYRASHYLVLLVAIMSLLSILGYLYQVKIFYGFLVHISMAPCTALCFFIFSLIVLFTDPSKGIMEEFTTVFSGSIVARFLIPAAIIVPSILGLLRLHGHWQGVYSTEFGTALYVLSIIIVFAGMTWYNAWLLNKRDALKKQTENALRDSERHIQAIFRNAPDAVVVVDNQGIITKWNPEAERIFGWKENEIKGQVLSELIIPERSRGKNESDVKGFFIPGDPMLTAGTIDLPAIKKDQSSVDVSLKTSPVVLEQKQFFICFIRDITGRIEMERKLKTFNEELSTQVADKTSELSKAKDLADKLIDSLPGVFYFFDANGKFIRWNKEFERATGYSSEEIADMHPTDFFSGDEKKYIAERIEGVFVKGINDAEANFLTRLGALIPYYFKAVLINLDGKPCLLGNGIDITQRKKAETELIASEHKYKLLFESNPLPMWMLNLPAYTVNDVNNAALLQYGYTKEEFLKLSVFDFRPPEDIEKFMAATNTKFRGIHHSGIWRHIRKNGTIIYVDIITYDINYKGQQIRLVLANDVTEKYIAEEKLKESYDAIRKLTEYLQNVREEERLYMAREIHDELGQLLTVMKMDVAWINRRTEPENTGIKEKLSEILSVIDTTAKAVRRIASELRPSLLDDLGLVAAMEWHLEEFEKRSGISKELYIPDTEIILPDSLKIGIFRIFQESLTNVARHAEATKVIVSLIQNDKELVLTIKDNGKGFDEKEGDKKTLGLLGMKERTQMMGGEYSISGIAGEGTIVTVMIPLPEANL